MRDSLGCRGNHNRHDVHHTPVRYVQDIGSDSVLRASTMYLYIAGDLQRCSVPDADIHRRTSACPCHEKNQKKSVQLFSNFVLLFLGV